MSNQSGNQEFRRGGTRGSSRRPSGHSNGQSPYGQTGSYAPTSSYPPSQVSYAPSGAISGFTQSVPMSGFSSSMGISGLGSGTMTGTTGTGSVYGTNSQMSAFPPMPQSSAVPSGSQYFSEIEASILRSNDTPVQIDETDELSVLGQRGIWANKSEVVNWKGPMPIEQYTINEG
jgi:hypothetical protein